MRFASTWVICADLTVQRLAPWMAVEKHHLAAVGLAFTDLSTASPLWQAGHFPTAAVLAPGKDGPGRIVSDGLVLALDVPATSLCRVCNQEFRADSSPCILTFSGQGLFMEGLYSSAHGHARQGQGLRMVVTETAACRPISSARVLRMPAS